jgi:predicted PurR-regulated permease PerM
MASRRRASGDAESTWARAKPLFLAAFLTILTIVALRLIIELRGLLILLVLSLALAAAMSRPAAVLERRGIPRGIAVAVVQLSALAALLAAGYVVLPPLLAWASPKLIECPGSTAPSTRSMMAKRPRASSAWMSGSAQTNSSSA